jgi:hypothetical protein
MGKYFAILIICGGLRGLTKGLLVLARVSSIQFRLSPSVERKIGEKVVVAEAAADSLPSGHLLDAFVF